MKRATGNDNSFKKLGPMNAYMKFSTLKENAQENFQSPEAQHSLHKPV